MQLDSVNVLARAHYMPFYSRLGPYPQETLDRWLWRSGELFEYWAHEACLIPIEDRPLFVWAMERGSKWKALDRLAREKPDLIDRVFETVSQSGPIRVGEIDEDARTEAWWGWTDTKIALEYLFLTGRLTVFDRPNFTRLYEIPERVHPDALNHAAIDEHDARRAMLLRAISALGIGTASDLLDYYRLRGPATRALIGEMVDDGELVPVDVEGWKEQAYVTPAVGTPRTIPGAGFLSPFDPVVWSRPRAERLFDFFYRIEIYVPAPKRVHGYYVLPFRLGDRLAGRADLKADRKDGRLLVKGAFAEPWADPVVVGGAMRHELGTLAGWLGLNDVVIEPNGDLARHLV